jgi:hypothetical protein
MMQIPKTLNKVKTESGDHFSIVPVAIMVFLILSFEGAATYVLISSLL